MKEISDFSTSVMWWNVKLIHMWRNFRFLLICHVQKFEIPPHDRFFLNGHRPCVRDKYQVWLFISSIAEVEIQLVTTIITLLGLRITNKTMRSRKDKEDKFGFVVKSSTKVSTNVWIIYNPFRQLQQRRKRWCIWN